MKNANVRLSVESDWIDISDHLNWLGENSTAGAVVNFIGQVRQQNLNDEVSALTLEHYPAMTQQTLSALIANAFERWPLVRVSVHHRIGRLEVGDPIVFVGASSPHRDAAFDAVRFLMDKLKTQAPFWKKETTATGERWLEARASDASAASSWD